jgi:SAM-dependent methyltransferase
VARAVPCGLRLEPRAGPVSVDDASRDVPAGPPASGDEAWERAYLRFQSPAQEIRKFVRRLRQLGARSWPRDAAVLELFCGRGNGLRALERMGFTNLTGVDLSPTLATRYQGPARVLVHDCRQLPFPADSYDVAIVHGGLHHLPVLPDDLARTLHEVRRVLRPGGRFVVVEPWRTPFLDFFHLITRQRVARRLWPKLDAYETMQEHEAATFNRWISAPAVILGLLRSTFVPVVCRTGWGKLHFVGSKAPIGAAGRPRGDA